MKNFLQQNKLLIQHISILFISILSAYIFFQYLFTFIAPFFIGWLFSLLFTPFVNFLENKANIPRWIGSLISILLLIAFFAVIVFFMKIFHFILMNFKILLKKYLMI